MITFEQFTAIFSTIITVLALLIALDGNRRTYRNAVREATEVVYKEWWSEELHSLRRYFYDDFLPNHRAKLIGKSIKDIENVVPGDKGRTRQLCYFFDRVGWLGAAGLIDVDYVLGPMLHYLRRTWIVMEPLIEKSRIYEASKPYDPVYQWGFEWLYLRSNHPGKRQATLLRRSFNQPSILTRQEFRELAERINIDEIDFRRRITDLVYEKTDNSINEVKKYTETKH